MEKKLYLRELISVTEKEEEEEFSFIQIIPAETHRGPLIPIETNCYFVKLDRKVGKGREGARLFRLDGFQCLCFPAQLNEIINIRFLSAEDAEFLAKFAESPSLTVCCFWTVCPSS